MVLDKYLAAVKQRLEKATPGPWHAKNKLDFYDIIIENESVWVATLFKHEDSTSNADLITNAPTDLKTLIEIVEKQQAALNYCIGEAAHALNRGTGGKSEACMLVEMTAWRCLAECEKLVGGK